MDGIPRRSGLACKCIFKLIGIIYVDVYENREIWERVLRCEDTDECGNRRSFMKTERTEILLRQTVERIEKSLFYTSPGGGVKEVLGVPTGGRCSCEPFD